MKKLIAIGALVAAAGLSLRAQVLFDRILHATAEPQNWLTYSGSTMGQRYSPLNEITTANARSLELKWIYQVQSLEKFEATPLVVDGVMYTVSAPNDVIALDAATGRVFWTYSYTPSAAARLCCGRVNRGLAILGHQLFMGTIDGHLISLDAKSGGLVWNINVGSARAESGYGFTMAPLVVKDKVLIGSVGGEFGVRGFLAAIDAKTGKEAWRFNTIPGPGEKGNNTWAADSWKNGGGPLWVTGSYDPDLNLTYWGIGNPGPDWNGDKRAGDNLYTESVVALDPDTGALKWHFQFTPHDEFDFDSVQVPVLADIQYGGRPRKAMMWANRNGFWYVLDRTSGEFLLGKPFVKTNWNDGLDAKGRPINVKPVTAEGTLIYPGNQGGTNWYSPSFSPRTGLFYIPSWMDTYATYIKRPVEYAEGQRFTGALPVMSVRMLQPGPLVNRRLPEEGYGAIQAFDPKTGERKWAFNMSDMTESGVLSTAGDVVFAGGRDGYFFALDAKTGTMLWKASVGGAVSAGPMTYGVNNKQYVAISAGNALLVYGLR